MSDKKAPLVLIMAGGTGGHIFPALATSEALKEQGCRIHWLGTPASMEAELAPRHGIDISFIPVTGLRGKGAAFLFRAPWKLAVSLVKALNILRKLKPVCVVGMGGYVTGPGGVAARILGIPLVIHEQNAVAGLTNKLLAKISSKVLQAFPDTFTGIAESKRQLTGNPVRASIAAVSRLVPHQPLRLLVLGGSRGAQAINEIMPEVVSQCGDKVTVWHQTGANNFSECQNQYSRHSITGRIEPFIDDMAAAYEWSNLVICRSGALTVAELAAAGRPSILVPFPFAVDDHQTVNGRFLVDQKAAVMIQQKDLEVNNLTTIVMGFSADADRLNRMADAARSVSLPDATRKVVDHCLQVSGLEVNHG